MLDWVEPLVHWGLQAICYAAIATLVFILFVGLPLVATFCLSLPLRRAARARLFLTVLENTIAQGRPVEETLIALARSRDCSMGLPFHLLAAWMESSLNLEAALVKVPGFLPPQVTAMLRAGRAMGDLRKVFPACRQLLKDASSQVQGAFHYLILFTFVISPVGFVLFDMVLIFIIPKFSEVFGGMNVHPAATGVMFINLIRANTNYIILAQCICLALVWLAVLLYLGGPRVAAWCPPLERVHFALPWRRRRMQRDFSSLLAVLLDAGVPEAEALYLAADCAANAWFQRRADRAIAALAQGTPLPEAVQALDDSGEFRWRLRNAAGAPGGFLRALTGWHEALDARAFQLEQAAAHFLTTLVVIFSGAMVGMLAISVFMFFVAMINQGVLW